LHLGNDLVGLGSKAVIPPSERGGVVANKLLVVNIVMLSSSPEWDEVVERPWEFVSRVGIDSLEETEDNPNVHGDDVEVSGKSDPHDWDSNTSETKSHDLNGRGELSGNSEGGGVLVV